MCSQAIPLPQIKRIGSGDIRNEWKKMTNSQRRLSLDFLRSSASETNLIKNKDKCVLRLQKVLTKQPNPNPSVGLMSKMRSKSSANRISQNVSNALPVFGDHKTILEASQLLELIKKSEDNELLINCSPDEVNQINVKREELQKLLRLKCKFCIRDDCLNHSIKANALVQDLRNLYFEDNYKLNVIKTYKNDDKRKVKILDSFVKSSSVRRNLCEDMVQRSSSWISLITNANRLMNVTHISAIDDGLELIVQKTVKELKYFRLCSISLMRIILEVNIELMSSLIDLLPFECISHICLWSLNFDKHLVSDQIKPLYLIDIVATNQAKVTINKFLYYLYNETNKRENLLNNSIERQLNLEEITSDYFSASSISTAINQKNKSSNFDSKLIKDFKIVFNILIQSNQRILLKLIFGHQENRGRNEIKSSGYRQKWLKSDDFLQESQQKLCREFDQQFWNKFWSEFDDLIKSSLCFCDSSNTSVPISVLYNQTKAKLINSILEFCICDEELLQEAVKSLELAQYHLLFRHSLHYYCQNYTKFRKLIRKLSLKIEKNKFSNRIGTEIGLTLINIIEPLLEIKIKYNEKKNASEFTLDYIIDNIVYIFLAYIESKQSLELDNHFPAFIALSILDINNLNKLLSTAELKWMNELTKIFNCIKKCAFLRAKEYMFSKSYEFISKTIPTKQYRRKICSTNSQWIENIIQTLLEPISHLLSKESSFDSTLLLSNMIEEFAKAFVECVYKGNKIVANFSPSGAIQFNKDVDTFWDYVVNNSLQSSNLNAITQLKSISFSLVNRDKQISTLIKRNNRISPTVSPVLRNQITDSSSPYQGIRSNYRNCISFMMCSHY